MTAAPSGAETAGAESAVAGTAALEVSDLTVGFGGLVAVDQASLRVAAGEIVGLIGSNGAGKTTLMDCISGFVEPWAGSITVEGVELTGLAPELRPYVGVGRSFQDARLYPGLTVDECLLVAVERHHPARVMPALLGIGSRRREAAKLEAVDRLATTLGLGPHRDKRASELSTGTRRVVDIASILAQRPALLLLDEPTAGIAQREAEAFAPLLRRVQDELGCAVLIIEHDMPLIMGVSDRVYAMESGRVIAEGPPDRVRRDPRVVASYLGTDQAAINRSGPGGGGRRATTTKARTRTATSANGKTAGAGTGAPNKKARTSRA
jgi:ABC-type branched-subunit amino acid transport system ATPase component